MSDVMMEFVKVVDKMVREVYDTATVWNIDKSELCEVLVNVLNEIYDAKKKILELFRINENTGFALRELSRAEDRIVKLLDILVIAEPTDVECPICRRRMFYDKGRGMYICPNCGLRMSVEAGEEM